MKEANELSDSSNLRSQMLDERFRWLAENAPDVIFRFELGSSGGFHYVSPAVTHVLGYLPEEFYADPQIWKRIVHPDNQVPGLVSQRSMIIRVLHKDGRTLWVSIRTTPIHDDRDNLVALEGIARDITEQKRIESELQMRGRQQEAVAELGQLALTGTDVSTLMDVAVHRLAESLRVEYAKVLELLPGENTLLLRSGVGWDEGLVGQVTVAGGADTQAGYTLLAQEPVIVEDLRTETRFRGPPLHWDHGVVSGMSVIIGSCDRPFGVLGAHTAQRRSFSEDDVHFLRAVANILAAAIEHSEAEDALRESEARFRRLAENAPDAIFRLEMKPVRRLSYVNSGATRLLGYRPEEYYADPNLIFEIADPEYRHALLSALRDRVSTEPQTVSLRHKAGHQVWVEVRSVPVYDEGGILVALEGIARDITGQKRMEEQLLRAHRLEAAGQLAGQVAHDFNNLLGPLALYPDLIKLQLPEGHPTAEYCDIMLESVRHMAEINSNMLALVRRAHVNREVVDLNRVIENAVAQMAFSTDSLVVELSLAPDLLAVSGSPAQLLRVVTNLLSNAREAMEDIGRVRVETENLYVDEALDHRSRMQVGEYVRLSVSDSGPGIPPEIRGRLFDPFFTTKTSTANRGSGLGLSIVQAIVEDHGGQLDLESEVGLGSTFTVYLPASRAATAERETATPERGRERVLVVDDDPLQRRVLSAALSELGYATEAVASGEEALIHLSRHEIDLVLLDMVMPGGIDGAETYRRARPLRPKLKAIILSGYAQSERVREAQRLGAGAYLRKPVNLGDLAQAVREELSGSRPAR